MVICNLSHSELPLHDGKKLDKTILIIEELFKNNRIALSSTIKKAHLVKKLIDKASYFIQKNISEVCPSCENVCCINYHAYHDYEDIVYMYAIGLKLPDYKRGIKDSDPCQFLSEHGCKIERAVRPFRCNWYFCEPLLRHIENGPARPYREFINIFHEIIDIRSEMLKEFFSGEFYLDSASQTHSQG